MKTSAGLVQQMKRAAASADERHEFGEQALSKFVGLLRALQRVGDFRHAGLDPALALRFVHSDAIRFHRARHFAQLRVIILIADARAGFPRDEIAQAQVQVRERIHHPAPVKQQQRAHHG